MPDWKEIIIILGLIMINPPFLHVVSKFAENKPFIGQLPTLYLWFYLWFIIIITAFVVAAITSKSWSGEKIERRLKKLDKNSLKE